jgi:hypothetical protein
MSNATGRKPLFSMYMYFAMLIHMVVVDLPNVECYWKKAPWTVG